MSRPRQGGGWPAIRYTFAQARAAGGIRTMWKALRTRNTCKTCALGMGGQQGGMVNESGRFPEFCKKSVQAMAADMQPGIPDAFWKDHSLDRLRSMTSRQLERCGRLAFPVRTIEGQAGYEPLSWDEALDHVAHQLAATEPEHSFFYFSGRSSNEAGFLLQLFARLHGTNNVNNCSFYCHQASGVGLSSVIGSGTATLVLEDLDQADLVFVIGANPASNHPRLMRSLLEVKRRGGHVVVINPIREAALERFRVPSDARSLLFGSRIADIVLQPHIGGDLALLYGLSKAVLDSGAADENWLEEHTVGWRDLRTRLESLSWEEIELKSGVARGDIERTASLYARADNTIFSWAMGITHHAHGTANVQAIAGLALMRAMVGRPGCGLMPIRGHSNVQGIGSVGVTPTLKKAIFKNLESKYGLDLPTTPGLDTMACMESAAEGHMKLGICLGGNLYGSNPDSDFAARAFSNLETVVYLSTTLNTGHAWGTGRDTIILPVLARDEEPQPTSQESMFNFVRLSDGGPARLEGPRSEVDVIADLAERVSAIKGAPVGAVDWSGLRDRNGIRDMISEVVPGFEAMKTMNARREEFQIGGRTFHVPSFATPDGRARLHTHVLPELSGTEGELRLMTIRSEGQFNTVVYEEEDLYRGATERNVILLSPEDLRKRSLKDGDRIRVTGPAGRMSHVRATTFDRIRLGNAAMYFPEANVLLGRSVDSESRTPAFKGACVSIEP